MYIIWHKYCGENLKGDRVAVREQEKSKPKKAVHKGMTAYLNEICWSALDLRKE